MLIIVMILNLHPGKPLLEQFERELIQLHIQTVNPLYPLYNPFSQLLPRPARVSPIVVLKYHFKLEIKGFLEHELGDSLFLCETEVSHPL